MKQTEPINRRMFLTRTARGALLASAAPSILPSSVWAAARQPGERITVGCIGTGSRGQAVMGHFLNQPDCRVVAVCDAKQNQMSAAKGLVDKHYQDRSCAAIADFRELAARPDIDAVLIASTDNWHVLHALAAVRAGKDVYVEKPLGLSLGENQLLRQECLKRKRIFQFGTQQRSDRKFRVACELVRNGHIGKLKSIHVWSPASSSGGSTKQVPPPPGLDYEMWLGPAPYRPHTENLTSNSVWWFVSDFALGFIAGWGIHPLDIALWGAGDLARDKVTITGKGTYPTEGVCNTATSWDADLAFANGLTIKFVGSRGAFPQQAEWAARYGKLQPHGTAFEGTEGWIHVNRASIVTKPESLIEINPDSFKTRLTYSPDHVKNFLASIRSRQATVSDIHSAVLSDAFCHVSDIALRLGRKLTYDVEGEKFVGDKEANQPLALRALRAPWKA
jgi:predicted dehydrogenase